MRDTGFPFTRRHLDQDPTDTVRRFRGKPGDAGRSLAATVRHGGEFRRTRNPAEDIAPWQVSTVPAKSGADHAEHRQSASGFWHCRVRRRGTARQHHLCPCLDCAKRYELSWVKEKFDTLGERAPDCGCGGHIKTATISFGQQMPLEAMERAEELTRNCDLFLAVGSSLVVWPAAGFPLMAKRNGAALVIINREPTDFDDIADLVVRNDIGDALSPFITH